MKHTFLKGTQFPFGATFVELLSDTEMEVVNVDSLDHLAETMAGGNQKMFGNHLDSLKHTETTSRNVDGVAMEQDVEVSYGAGGARVETDKGDPRPVKAAAPASLSATPAPVAEPPDEFSSDFPGFAELTAAGISKRSELRGKSIEELEKINGITPEIAQRIHTEFVPAMTAEEIAADQEAARAAIAEQEAEKTAEAEAPVN